MILAVEASAATMQTIRFTSRNAQTILILVTQVMGRLKGRDDVPQIINAPQTAVSLISTIA